LLFLNKLIFLNKFFFLYFIMPRHTGKGGGRAGAGRGRAGGNGRGRSIPPPTPRTQRAMRSIPRGGRSISQPSAGSGYALLEGSYARARTFSRGSQGTVWSAPTNLYKASRNIVRQRGVPVDVMKQGRTGFGFPSGGRGFFGNYLPHDINAVRNRIAGHEAATIGATGLARAAQQRRGRAAAAAAAAKARAKSGNGKNGNGDKGGKK
jgi:hypothetical protein